MSWWINYKDDFILMLEYIESIKTRSDLEDFFKDYKIETIVKMIFESNLVENKNLDLIESESLFEYLQSGLSILERKNLDFFKENNEIFKEIIKQLKITNLDNNIFILNKSKNKNSKITLRHLVLIGGIEELIETLKVNSLDLNVLFSPDALKIFHKILSFKLTNNKNGKPGKYRFDNAIADIDTIFLQPSKISKAMDKAFEVFLQNLNDGKNIYLEVMLFVAKFINIHPFGDCNGRLSRFILNLAFLCDDVPFYLVLRSNSRDKKKYIESMKEFYQKKKISKFISVVSKIFIKQIKEINERLELTNKELIKPLALSNEFKEKIKIELEKL
ncbi:Fic family protein [Cetobacterium sp.]|uniref:Fic family protein n=1 Tax=Cetobacterium sp. TaxID=2071632 RepID=UPI003EE55B2E